MKQLFCTLMMLCSLSNISTNLTLDQEETFAPEIITFKEVPIFMYHNLSIDEPDTATIPVDIFEEHMKALSEAGVEAVSFQDLVDFVYHGGQLPENPVVITFDDGYQSNFELAFPILQKYNMKATLFVIGITVGESTYPNTDIPIFPHFSYEEAQTMIDSGLVSIQSHTYNLHQWAPLETGVPRPDVSQLPNESDEEYIQMLSKDYLLSKAEIEKNTSETVEFFSYPGGAYTDFSEEILESLGVLATVTVNPEMNYIVRGQPSTLFSLNRYAMDTTTNIDLVLQRAGVLETPIFTETFFAWDDSEIWEMQVS